MASRSEFPTFVVNLSEQMSKFDHPRERQPNDDWDQHLQQDKTTSKILLHVPEWICPHGGRSEWSVQFYHISEASDCITRVHLQNSSQTFCWKNGTHNCWHLRKVQLQAQSLQTRPTLTTYHIQQSYVICVFLGKLFRFHMWWLVQEAWDSSWDRMRRPSQCTVLFCTTIDTVGKHNS